MESLIDLVARRAGLSQAQAREAVGAVLDYLTAGLPSPVVGRIHELLRGDSLRPGQNGDQENSPP